MSNPTDLLTTAINRAVREAVKEELAPFLAQLKDVQRPPTTVKDLLTTVEVSELTGIAENTLRRWRSDQDPAGPPFVRMGRAVRYRRQELDAWMRASA